MTNHNDPRCVLHSSRRARRGRWDTKDEQFTVPAHLPTRCENVATTTITQPGPNGEREIAVCQECADRSNRFHEAAANDALNLDARKETA